MTTLFAALHESVIGTKQPYAARLFRSAWRGKADISQIASYAR